MKKFPRKIVRIFKRLPSFTRDCLLRIALYLGFFKSENTKCIFTTQYYKTNDVERQKEIDDCLAYNVSQSWISQLVVFCEQGASPPLASHPKITLVEVASRLAYRDVFEWFKKNSPSSDSVIIFANSDIFITSDVEVLIPRIYDNDFLALTRYESFDDKYPFLINTTLPGAVSFSQDTWIFRASAVAELANCTPPEIILGILGCESSLLAGLFSASFNISNPCLNVKTVHNHKTKLRTYTSSSRLLGTYVYPKTMTNAQFLFGKRYKPVLNEVEIIH